MMQRLVAVGVVLAALGTNVAADRIAPPPPAPAFKGDPVAVAVVLEGPLVHLPGDPAIDDPLFAALQLALDTIAERAPAGSMGATLVYYSDVLTVRELGPLSTMRGDVLGTPASYEDRMGRNLVGGITHALAELEQSRSERKALIVVGDGADNQLDLAPGEMRGLHDRAARHGIELYALVYDVGLGDKLSAVNHFPGAHVRALKSHLDIVPAFEWALQAIIAQPAPEPPPAAPAPAAAAAGGTRTLAWSLLAAGVVLGALGAVAMLRRRAAPTVGRAS